MSRLAIASHSTADAAVLLGPGGAVDAARFFAAAARLASALPDGGHVINLCDSRHGFLLGFAAALMGGRVSLLPPARGPEVWRALQRRYPGACVLSEMQVAGERCLAIAPFLEDRAAGRFEIPEVDADAIAAILFTSGSTGEPAAHAKSWGQLCRGASLLAAALGWDARPAQAIVGSVPPQHMFGLESTVVLAWRAGIPVHARTPLLAADLENALRECGRPAWWMTTPLHMRAPLQAAALLPGLRGIVASTMSLPPALASAGEIAWRVPVVEVYGSTETGAIATRRTASEIAWTPLPGVVLRPQGEGEAQRFRAEGPHIDPPVVLGDSLEIQADGRFRWLGRSGDMVKIGGKRASLSALNTALTGIPGVTDGVFSLPPAARSGEPQSGREPRLAAFFVSDALEPAQVLEALRERIDPAFLPRPIHRVDRLPRNATGKLPRAALDEMFTRWQGAQAIAPDHPALPGHFPGDPLVPGVTVLARVADALRARFGDCVPGELVHARFHRPLRPGEPFAIVAREEAGRARFEVRRAGDNGEQGGVIASGEWALLSALPDAPRP